MLFAIPANLEFWIKAETACTALRILLCFLSPSLLSANSDTLQAYIHSLSHYNSILSSANANDYPGNGENDNCISDNALLADLHLSAYLLRLSSPLWTHFS